MGLGNTEITPDALGPAVARGIFATRHIPKELTKAAAEKIKPAAVIVIDALAAQSGDRLFKTVQLCDTGISPGSGVKNNRGEISEKTVGVPVIAIGVPTVIDADTLSERLTGILPEKKSEMFVTPKDVDMLTQRLAKLLAEAINMFLQPETDPEIISALV